MVGVEYLLSRHVLEEAYNGYRIVLNCVWLILLYCSVRLIAEPLVLHKASTAMCVDNIRETIRVYDLDVGMGWVLYASQSLYGHVRGR